MSRPVDDFTSTVDGAAAFERYHSPEPYDNGPSLAEIQRDEWDAERGLVADVLHDCLSSFQGWGGVPFDREAAVEFLLSPASGLTIRIAEPS